VTNGETLLQHVSGSNVRGLRRRVRLQERLGSDLWAEVQEGEKSGRGAVRPGRPELDQVEGEPAEVVQSYSENTWPRPKESVTYEAERSTFRLG